MKLDVRTLWVNDRDLIVGYKRLDTNNNFTRDWTKSIKGPQLSR